MTWKRGCGRRWREGKTKADAEAETAARNDTDGTRQRWRHERKAKAAAAREGESKRQRLGFWICESHFAKKKTFSFDNFKHSPYSLFSLLRDEYLVYVRA